MYDEAAKAEVKDRSSSSCSRSWNSALVVMKLKMHTPDCSEVEKDGVDGLAAASLNTADSFAKMVEGLLKLALQILRQLLKSMQSYDL